MLKKLISYLIIFSIFYSDAVWCGRDRVNSICDPEQAHRHSSVKMKTTRARSQSLSDFRRSCRHNDALINFDPSPFKIKKTISVGHGIVSSDDTLSSDTTMDIVRNKTENNSNSLSMTSLTITSSSTNSSPREDEGTNSPMGTTNSSPTKSSESFDSIDKDSPDGQSVVLDRGDTLPHQKVSIENKEPMVDLLVKEGVESLAKQPSFENPLTEEKEPNVKAPLVHLLIDNKTQEEELLQGEGNVISLPLDPVILPHEQSLKRFEEKIEIPLPSMQEEKQQPESQIITDLIQGITPSSLLGSFPQDKEQESTSRRNSDASEDDEKDRNIEKPIVSEKNTPFLLRKRPPPKKQKENKEILAQNNGEMEGAANKLSISSFYDLPSENSDAFVDLLKEPKANNEADSDSTDLQFKGGNGDKAPLNHLEQFEFTVVDSGSSLSLDEKKKAEQEKRGVPEKKEESKSDQAKPTGEFSSLSLEGDISNTNSKKIIKNKKDEPASADEWVDYFENPGSSGNSQRNYELNSFYDDEKGARSLLINGDDKPGGRENKKRVVEKKRPSAYVDERTGPWQVMTERTELLNLSGDHKFPNGAKKKLKLVPDFLKFSQGLIQQENVLTNVRVLFEEEDLNEGPRRFNLNQFLNDLPKEAKADLKGRVALWEEVVAMLTGAGVGGVAAYGAMLLINQSIFTLATQYNYWFYKILTDDFNNYILTMALVDLVPRGALYGKKTLHYLSRQGANMTDVIFLGAASFLPSLISPFALIATGLETINLLPKIYVLVEKQMLTYSPFLYLSDFSFNINMLAGIRTNIKKWVGTSESNFASLTRRLTGNLFYSSLPSLEEIRKRSFNKKLGALRHKLPFMSNEEVAEIYEEIKKAKKTIATELPELDPDNFKAAEKFFTSLYLLSWGEEVQQAAQLSEKLQEIIIKSDPMEEKRGSEFPHKLMDDSQNHSTASLLPENEEDKKRQLTQSRYKIYEKATDGFNVTALVVGSIVRLIALKFIVQDMLKTVVYVVKSLVYGRADEAVSGIVKGVAWTIALVIGFAAQTALEYKGTKNFTNMIYSEGYEGHESYPWARRSVKFYSAVHGFLLITSVAVLVLQAITDLFGDEWRKNPEYTAYKWASLPFIISYLYAEWATQTTIVEESYNQQLLTGATDVYNQYIREPQAKVFSYVLPEVAANKDSCSPKALYNQYIREPLCRKNSGRDYQQDWLIRFIKETQVDMNHRHPNILFQQEKLLNARSQAAFENI